jgi:hypothetical protein
VDDEHANPTGAIYGTILVMAVITAISHDKDIGPGEIIAAVGVVDGAFGLLVVALKVLVHQLTCSTPVTLSTPWSTSARASPRPRMTSLPPKAQMTSGPDVPFQRIGHEVARRAEAREVTSSTSSRSSASTRAWPRRVRSSARGA